MTAEVRTVSPYSDHVGAQLERLDQRGVNPFTEGTLKAGLLLGETPLWAVPFAHKPAALGVPANTLFIEVPKRFLRQKARSLIVEREIIRHRGQEVLVERVVEHNPETDKRILHSVTTLTEHGLVQSRDLTGKQQTLKSYLVVTQVLEMVGDLTSPGLAHAPVLETRVNFIDASAALNHPQPITQINKVVKGVHI